MRAGPTDKPENLWCAVWPARGRGRRKAKLPVRGSVRMHSVLQSSPVETPSAANRPLEWKQFLYPEHSIFCVLSTIFEGEVSIKEEQSRKFKEILRKAGMASLHITDFLHNEKELQLVCEVVQTERKRLVHCGRKHWSE